MSETHASSPCRHLQQYEMNVCNHSDKLEEFPSGRDIYCERLE